MNLLSHFPSKKVDFCSNHIRSSKYTFLSFWILNPLEQFRRMANFTYLVMGIVQFCLPDPPVIIKYLFHLFISINMKVPAITTIIPLAFVVVVSMVKQVKSRQNLLKNKKSHQFI